MVNQDDGKDWSPKEACTQVKIVDLIQFIMDEKDAKICLPLVVVISAWDVVKKVDNALSSSPRKWLQKHLPLLYQFLCSNPERFDLCYYGISAQGGDYETDKDHLLDLSPIQRAEIIAENNEQSDISSPLKWILDKARKK
jgi:hypothetical protein